MGLFGPGQQKSEDRPWVQWNFTLLPAQFKCIIICYDWSCFSNWKYLDIEVNQKNKSELKQVKCSTVSVMHSLSLHHLIPAGKICTEWVVCQPFDSLMIQRFECLTTIKSESFCQRTRLIQGEDLWNVFADINSKHMSRNKCIIFSAHFSVASLSQKPPWILSAVFRRRTCHSEGDQGCFAAGRPVNNLSVRPCDGLSSASSLLLSGAIYPKQLLH